MKEHAARIIEYIFTMVAGINHCRFTVQTGEHSGYGSELPCCVVNRIVVGVDERLKVPGSYIDRAVGQKRLLTCRVAVGIAEMRAIGVKDYKDFLFLAGIDKFLHFRQEIMVEHVRMFAGEFFVDKERGVSFVSKKVDK